MGYIPSQDIFDKKELLERVEGDEDFVREITDVFLEQAPVMFDTLEAAIDSEDFYQVSRTAHELKGSASNIGAPRVTDTAKNLKNAAEQKDIKAVHHEFSNLQNHFEELKHVLHTTFSAEKAD